MKYIWQLMIILFISFLSEIIAKLIPAPIPACIYGIVILFILLKFKVLKLEQVSSVGHFLIEIMPLMFIPASVSLLEQWELLQPLLLPFSVIIVVSFLLVFIVSGLVTKYSLKVKEHISNSKKEIKENNKESQISSEDR